MQIMNLDHLEAMASSSVESNLALRQIVGAATVVIHSISQGFALSTAYATGTETSTVTKVTIWVSSSVQVSRDTSRSRKPRASRKFMYEEFESDF
jgi:hypothetical protein